MLSMPGSDISYHDCYVIVYSLVLLTINLHSVIKYNLSTCTDWCSPNNSYDWCLCLHLIYTNKTVMQKSSRTIIQSAGAFLNEDKLFVVTSYTASSEINLSCSLRWSWQHGDDWGIFSPWVYCGRWYPLCCVQIISLAKVGWMLPGTHSHVLYYMTYLLNSYSR
jgi:hypothetical protein